MSSLPESARQQHILNEDQFLEVRIRGKNRTFAKKKGSAFVTLEEQTKLQQQVKQQQKQNERLRNLQLFEREREVKIKQDFEREMRNLEMTYNPGSVLITARKR